MLSKYDPQDPNLPDPNDPKPRTTTYRNDWTQQGSDVNSPTPQPLASGGQSLSDFQRDYWAPDRSQVLAGMQQPQAQQPQASSASGGDWITNALQSVQSKDDPGFWQRVIGQHGDTNNPSAQAYWIDRIRRGDGSALVANGSLQKFQDGGGSGGSFGSGGSPFQDQIRQMLLEQIKKGSQPVDLNAPEIAQPFDAASQTAQRSLEGERKALAERLYGQNGGDAPGASNELQQGIQQSYERMGGDLAGVKAQLVQRSFQNKAQQLQQALQLAASSGDAEAARSIQMQLAQLDNAYRYASLGQNQSQWNDEYGLRKAQQLRNIDNNSTNYFTGGG